MNKNTFFLICLFFYGPCAVASDTAPGQDENRFTFIECTSIVVTPDFLRKTSSTSKSTRGQASVQPEINSYSVRPLEYDPASIPADYTEDPNSYINRALSGFKVPEHLADFKKIETRLELISFILENARVVLSERDLNDFIRYYLNVKESNATYHGLYTQETKEKIRQHPVAALLFIDPEESEEDNDLEKPHINLGPIGQGCILDMKKFMEEQAESKETILRLKRELKENTVDFEHQLAALNQLYEQQEQNAITDALVQQRQQYEKKIQGLLLQQDQVDGVLEKKDQEDIASLQRANMLLIQKLKNINEFLSSKEKNHNKSWFAEV